MQSAKWITSTSKALFIIMLMLLTCLKGSKEQEREWVSLQHAFEFLAGNETYFDNIPSDIVNSYFYSMFGSMLDRKNSRTGKWLFTSSHTLQQEQRALIEKLGESMDGSEISREYEHEILTDFEHYLERWIRVLKEHEQ